MNADREQDALLEAIFASPKDDTPRLVYADWLAEHGEEAYAEFIRVQVELAKETETAKQAPLKKRESAAWAKLKRKWRDLLAAPAVVAKSDFRRGFPFGAAESYCRMPVEQFLAVSERLWPRLPLRAVDLQTEATPPDSFFDCPYLRRLARIHFTHLWAYQRVFSEEFTVRLFSYGHFDRLVALDVNRVPLSRPVVKALRGSPYLKRLRRLYVWYLTTSDGNSQTYGSLRFPQVLTSANFGSGLAKNPGGAGKMLAKQLPRLESQLVVVPPSETSVNTILEHTALARGG